MKKEKTIINRVMLELRGHKLFRNNTGQAWQGKILSHINDFLKTKYKKNMIVIESPRPISFGLIEGSSDLIGWKVEDGRAIFCAVEIKTKKDRLSEKQKIFLGRVKQDGGIALVAKEKDDDKVEISEYE